MEEIHEKTKNLCAQIPESLHNRVREEQQRSGKSLSEYMTMLIAEYYNRKEGATMKDKNTRTLAIELSVELFDALDEHIARHPEIKSKKDFVTELIRNALEAENPAQE